MKRFLLVPVLMLACTTAFAADLGTYLSEMNNLSTLREIKLSDDLQDLVIRSSNTVTAYKATSSKSVFQRGTQTVKLMDANTVLVQDGGWSLLLTRIDAQTLTSLQDQARAEQQRRDQLALEQQRIRENAPITYVCQSRSAGEGKNTYFEVVVQTFRGTQSLATNIITPLTQEQMFQYVSSPSCK